MDAPDFGVLLSRRRVVQETLRGYVMEYVKVMAGVPQKYTWKDFRSDNPNVSVRTPPPLEFLAEYDVYPLTVAPVPPYDPATQHIAETPITGSGSSWSRGWEVTNKTAQEIADERQDSQDRAMLKADTLDTLDFVILKALYILNNRVRVLEGKAEITPAQFRNWVKSQF